MWSTPPHPRPFSYDGVGTTQVDGSSRQGGQRGANGSEEGVGIGGSVYAPRMIIRSNPAYHAYRAYSIIIDRVGAVVTSVYDFYWITTYHFVVRSCGHI